MERSVVGRRGAGIPPAWPAVVLGICFGMFVAGSSLGIYLTEVRIASVAIAAACLLVVFGARTGRRWLVPVAVWLSLPVVWVNSWVILLATIRLREPEVSPVAHPVAQGMES